MSGEVTEIRLEEVGEHSWWRALLNLGSYGSALFRFVACPPGPVEHSASAHRAVGSTFPVLRAQDLDDLHEPNAWLDTARESLRELDRDLVDAGWQLSPVPGPHWWSHTYTR